MEEGEAFSDLPNETVANILEYMTINQLTETVQMSPILARLGTPILVSKIQEKAALEENNRKLVQQVIMLTKLQRLPPCKVLDVTQITSKGAGVRVIPHQIVRGDKTMIPGYALVTTHTGVNDVLDILNTQQLNPTQIL